MAKRAAAVQLKTSFENRFMVLLLAVVSGKTGC